jgi:glucose/arabinose dehydrogenase
LNNPLTGGDLLVVDRGPENPDDRKDLTGARILALRDKNNDGKIEDGEWTTLAKMPGLNHGIAAHGGYLFASTSDKVYRWPYEAGAWEDLGDPEEVVFNMDMTGEPGYGGVGNPLGHTTRTLEFDNEGRMYVSVGSVGNVDGDSFRSRIRRIEGLAEEKSLSEPVDFTKAEIFADGLRNEVGLAWADDDKKVLYGVENGMDNLYRADLGETFTMITRQRN